MLGCLFVTWLLFMASLLFLFVLGSPSSTRSWPWLPPWRSGSGGWPVEPGPGRQDDLDAVSTRRAGLRITVSRRP